MDTKLDMNMDMDMNSKLEDGKKREWDTRTKNNNNKATPAQNLDVKRRLYIYKLIINGITRISIHHIRHDHRV